ncbi:RhuM family protein [Aquiflexum lacus]|uniref:RhuM family protein n=1 Tax=Aquiflexum lacus TaxID=2483805 RepID=UPI0018957527|nr:RhuM family protein [Aquiflexum lacus]
MKNEIILYRPNELAEHIEVRLEDETVWLNRNQISALFDRDVKTIGKHLTNVFKEGELDEIATVAKFATVQNEGGRLVERQIEYYNLDVIISVGYRVKSKQGTQFRIWANQVLKDYLLKGYSINNRMNRLEDNFETLKNKVNEIDLQISTHLVPTQGVFFDGQVFDAYELASKIIRSAKERIILIDNYIDETTLTHLAKKQKGVKVLLLTKTPSIGSGQANKQQTLDVQKANAQYGNFELKIFTQSHDRFLIIDNKEVYHLGASLKDLGKKWFAFSKLEVKSVEGIMNEIKNLNDNQIL